MDRARCVPLAVVALVVAVLVFAGCGADPHLQRQAAAARVATCQSIIERQDRHRGPDLSRTRWLAEVAKPPKSLTDTINEREIIGGCHVAEAELASAADRRSQLPQFFGAGKPDGGGESGVSSLLARLLRAASARGGSSR